MGERIPAIVRVRYRTRIARGEIASGSSYADLSTSLSAISSCLDLVDQYDVIIGSRKLKDSFLPIKRSPKRKFLSKVSNIFTSTVVPLKGLKDTQCGFKCFKTSLIQKEVLPKQTIEGFAFDIEYLYILTLKGIKIKEIPVTWTDDKESTVNLKSTLRFLLDTIKIRKNKEKYLKG